jgi:hypothetical protein
MAEIKKAISKEMLWVAYCEVEYDMDYREARNYWEERKSVWTHSGDCICKACLKENIAEAVDLLWRKLLDDK